MKTFAEVAFTPAVQALQERHGSRDAYARMAEKGAAQGLGRVEVGFLSAADSFYLATVSETGWPYVQHRGGPPGFLRVISPLRIAFADFRGNRQYVSVGNAGKDDRASMIVMDYAERRRLKLFGHLRFYELRDVDAGIAAVADLAGYGARVERVAVFDVESLDWNCPQHITQRFTLEQIKAMAGRG